MSKELLSKVKEHLSSKDALKTCIEAELVKLNCEYKEVNKKIQAHNSKKSITYEAFRDLIKDLASGDLSKERLAKLDEARTVMEKAHSDPEADALQKRSSEIEVPLDQLEQALKSLN